MTLLRVLVVDDEPLAREMMRSMIASTEGFEVIGEASNGREAAAEIDRLAPDVVLLDIEMPEVDGLEAVRRLAAERQPIYIFVTAYDRYAAEAFAVEALDYVLKPVSDKRLARALERARQRARERTLSRAAKEMVSLVGDLEQPPPAGPGAAEAYLKRLPVTANGRTRFVETDDIVWIESQDYYVRLHTRRGNPLVRATLKSLNQRLDPRSFCQVRRGALVNVAEVREVRELFKGAHGLELTDGTELRVSRSRWREVRERLAPRLRRD